ncbi:adenylate/guanylate cyclase domain-containing protein [Enterovirga sp. CN4-39]|uniref:adenylate/guanylate cyclase domain-containing protein n=1 Tax=Enterovirga sp. CN4-39 TaxID=3400910 RepID=UPI003C11A54D
MPAAMERSDAPSSAPPLKRKIAAIVAADVAGYSRLVAMDEEGTLRAFAAAREIFDGLVHRAGGRIFNTAGDSVMCEFDSAVEAVRAAVDIQDSLAAASQDQDPARRIEFRIGITIGDVVERGDDLLGDGVNIAARLESMAPPGGICVSRSVHEAVANKIPVEFQDIGPRRVKNFPQPLHAFVISRRPGALVAGEPVMLDARRERLSEVPADDAVSGRRRLLVALTLLVAAGAAAIPGLPMMMKMYGTWSEVARPPSRPESNLASQTPVEIVTAPPKTPAQSANVQKPPVRAAEKAPEKPPATDKPTQEKPAADDKPRTPPAERPKPMPVAQAAASFVALSRAGVLPDAKTVPELYHNARAFEAKGDRGAALRAYAAAAPVAGEAVDLAIRYVTLMRATLGAEAARKVAQELARTNPGKASALAAAMQSESPDRRARLEALASDNPDFLPASYFLAEALMEKRQGAPTLTDRRLAFAALDRFIEGAETGSLSQLFIDASFLEGWLEAARTRRGEIETFFASSSARPSASFSRSETGWIARVSLPEAGTQISARIGETGEAAPANGGAKPATNADIPLPQGVGRTTLYLTYRDLSGREAGPFPIPFDPASALVNAGRETLERFPDSWVSFRPDLPDLLSYGQLVVHRCALRAALIGFGDSPPQDILPLPPCEPGASAGPIDTRSVITLPAGTDSVQVQLAYADGTESQIRTFRRP